MPRSANISRLAAPQSTAPTRIHGLNLPHLLRVLSTTTPMMGSLTASKTRITTRITVTAASCVPEMSSTSVR